MPVLRKRNHWHGLALECLRRTRTRFSALCYAVCYLVHHRHNKPLFRGLSVATRGELSNAFRLSQAYVYIVPHFLAPKLAKFQKKRWGNRSTCIVILHSSAFSLSTPL